MRIVNYQGGVAVTKHDTDLVHFKALWIGGAGNVNIKTADGRTVLISGIAAGTLLPIEGTQVLSTSTTATLIIALT